MQINLGTGGDDLRDDYECQGEQLTVYKHPFIQLHTGQFAETTH